MFQLQCLTTRRRPKKTSYLYAELEQLFIEAFISLIPTVVVCYFDVHYDDEFKSTISQSSWIVQSNLIHTSPTHQTGNRLDLVDSHADDNFITSVTVHPNTIYDHHRIKPALNALKPAFKPSIIAKQNFKNTDIDAFGNEIEDANFDMKLCAGANARAREKLVGISWHRWCRKRTGPWRMCGGERTKNSLALKRYRPRLTNCDDIRTQNGLLSWPSTDAESTTIFGATKSASCIFRLLNSKRTISRVSCPSSHWLQMHLWMRQEYQCRVSMQLYINCWRSHHLTKTS